MDGTSIFYCNPFRPSLEAVITIASDVIANGYDLACVFDANTRFKVANYQGGDYVEAYLHMLRGLGTFFVETTGKSAADPVILRLAEMHDSAIISNDQYRDHIENFPWVDNCGDRLIKVNSFRDVVFVGNQGLRVEGNLGNAISKLERLVSRWPVN